MDGIFLDIETTGLDVTKHVPIDIAFKVIDLFSFEMKASYRRIIKRTKEEWDQKDPGSIEINGFSWNDVSIGKEPSIVTQEIVQILCDVPIQRGRSVFICQNPSFDRGFFNRLVPVYQQEALNWPYHWLDLASMFWAVNMRHLKRLGIALPEAMSLSKNAIAKAYHLPEESAPHRALGGVDHLITCYQAVMDRDAPLSVLAANSAPPTC